MMVYSRSHDLEKGEELMREFEAYNLKPDLSTYTNLMVLYKNGQQFHKAIELYKKVHEDPEIEGDELFYSVFMRICAKVHRCEMAVKVWDHLTKSREKMTCLPINAYIKALASRKDYAERAIEVWRVEMNKGMQPDSDTYVGLLKACGMIGDVKTAFNAIQDMKAADMPITVYIYNGLLRTYASAVASESILPSLRDLYVKDAWELFKNISMHSPEMISSNLLDSLLLVHTNGHHIDKAEGLVLPLYETYKLPMTPWTFEFIVKLYSDTNQL